MTIYYGKLYYTSIAINTTKDIRINNSKKRSIHYVTHPSFPFTSTHVHQVRKWKIFALTVAEIGRVLAYRHQQVLSVGVANRNARPKAKVVGGINRRMADKGNRVRTLMRRWPTLRHVSPPTPVFREVATYKGVRPLVSLQRSKFEIPRGNSTRCLATETCNLFLRLEQRAYLPSLS